MVLSNAKRRDGGLSLSRTIGSPRQLALSAAVIATLGGAFASATPLAWDPSLTFGGTPTAPTGSGGPGTWNNGVTANWSNSTGDIVWTDVNPPVDTAIFGGTVADATNPVLLGNSIIKTLGLTFTTSGYVIGAAGSTNILQVGATTVASQPVIDTTALNGGAVTFNAPVDLSGGAVATTFNPLLNFGTTAVTFNGLRDNGVSTLTINVNGASNITVNNTSGYGLTSPAAIVLSNTTSSRNWNIQAGATGGANMTVNGRITGSPTNTANNTFTFQTGGTLTLTDTTSDAVLTGGMQILGGSTLSLGVGNGATGIGVLGARTNPLTLGANSSTPSTAATLKFTAPVTLDNPIKTSGSSTVPITISTNSNVTLNGVLTNQVSQGQIIVNNTGSGTVEFAGGVLTSSTASSRTFTFLGNAPVNISGVIADGNGSTGGRLTYNGTNVLTVNNTNTFTGNTTVTTGVLATNNLAVGGAASGIGTSTTVAVGAAGTLRYTGATFANFDRTISGTTGYTIDVSQAGTNLTATSATISNGMTKAGAGTLTLTNVPAIGNLTVNGGRLALTGAVATGILTNAGGVDIKNGQLTLLYTGGSPAQAVRDILQPGFGVAFASGQFRSSTATATRGLGYKDDGAGTVTVKATLYGDADLDGSVTIIDFNALATTFGASSGKVWVDGDFDYDGAVGIQDFNALAVNFGQSLPVSDRAADMAPLLAFAIAHDDLATFAALTGVPEPTSIGLVAAGAVIGLRRRRKAC